MKCLVVYTSRSGNTEKLARAIAAALGPECVLAAAADAPSPENFDFIALGFGVYGGWPDGDLRSYMKRCRRKNVGLFMTLGAWPDSEHAFLCMGRAEGLLENCTTRVKFICQGGYTPEHLARMKSRPADSPHAWDAGRRRSDEASGRNGSPHRRRPFPGRRGEAAERAAAPGEAAEAGAGARRVRQHRAGGRSLLSRDRRRDARTAPGAAALPGLYLVRGPFEVRCRRAVAAGRIDAPGARRVCGRESRRRLFVGGGGVSQGPERGCGVRPAIGALRHTAAAVGPGRTAALSLPERAPDECVLFMGHGHAGGRSDFQYMAAASELAGLDPALHLACVEGEPSFDPVLPELRGKRVRLVPFMLVAGDHALNDMAGDGPESWKSRLEAAGYETECVLHGLGENPAVARYFAELV